MTCRYHDEKAICDCCPEQHACDAWGFPHATLQRLTPKGIRRDLMRVCTRCDEAKRWGDWAGDFGCCLACVRAALAQYTRRRRKLHKPTEPDPRQLEMFDQLNH